MARIANFRALAHDRAACQQSVLKGARQTRRGFVSSGRKDSAGARIARIADNHREDDKLACTAIHHREHLGRGTEGAWHPRRRIVAPVWRAGPSMKKFTPVAWWLTLAALIAVSCPANAETVLVKYRGEVDLAPFTCEVVTRSSFIERVCYDMKNTYMLINLRGTWYHYCEIDQGTVSGLLGADSMGHFYNASIKGKFDCRTHRAPAY